MKVFQNLREFIDFLDSSGQLVRIRRPVSVDLEMAEIADRTMKLPGGGPAPLFERPVLMDGTQSSIPVAINVFGSWRRISAALGVANLKEHATRIAELLKPEVPKGLWNKVQMLPKLAELTKVPPRKHRGTPPCQEVVLRQGEFDLTKLLPVLRTWPQDGGPFITMPLVMTRGPDDGPQNIGMYRMQIYGPDTTGMHWQRHKGGAAHFRAWKESGKGRMPVVVALGGEPATMYTPTMPEIVDYHMPPEGVFHNLVFVAIRKEYPGQVYKVMNGLWGMGLSRSPRSSSLSTTMWTCRTRRRRGGTRLAISTPSAMCNLSGAPWTISITRPRTLPTEARWVSMAPESCRKRALPGVGRI